MSYNTLFDAITNQLIAQDDAIDRGKMMSAPAISYKGKVFAFFNHDAMIFKLGKDFDLHSIGIHQYEHLAPFTSKPPMRAWFVIAEQAYWSTLADLALAHIKTELDK